MPTQNSCIILVKHRNYKREYYNEEIFVNSLLPHNCFTFDSTSKHDQTRQEVDEQLSQCSPDKVWACQDLKPMENGTQRLKFE